MKIIHRLIALLAATGWQLLAVADYSVIIEHGRVVLDNGSSMRAVVVPDKGGELSSLRVLFDGDWHELLYRALDYSGTPGWRGKAPLLWPATGISIAGEDQEPGYELDGKHYPMPFHGFAKDRPWQLVRKERSSTYASATLELRDDTESREYYPFGFAIQVEYRLDRDKLSLIYRVSSAAENELEMPFSIGNHITFNAPLIAGSKPAGVQFENDFPERLVRGTNRAFSGVVEASPFRGRKALNALPRRDSVSLGGGQGRAELTVHDPSGLWLNLRHECSKAPGLPFIQYNLWADTVDGFFSPEPWIGTQNSLNTGAGLVRLQPGESWDWQIDILPGSGLVNGKTGQEELK